MLQRGETECEEGDVGMGQRTSDVSREQTWWWRGGKASTPSNTPARKMAREDSTHGVCAMVIWRCVVWQRVREEERVIVKTAIEASEKSDVILITSHPPPPPPPADGSSVLRFGRGRGCASGASKAWCRRVFLKSVVEKGSGSGKGVEKEKGKRRGTELIACTSVREARSNKCTNNGIQQSDYALPSHLNIEHWGGVCRGILLHSGIYPALQTSTPTPLSTYPP
jgi:hypothetical protein